jgi:acetyl esterase/lipase
MMIMRSICEILTVGFVACTCLAQTAFPLWPNGAPGALGTAEKDIPTLTIFLPDSACATDAAVVICPGGGYHHLAEHEGEDYAQFFAMHGMTAFVLKYRLGSDGYRHPAMLYDATRALRIVRTDAVSWNINPCKIGIVGSSAGGHLASTLLTHFNFGDSLSLDPVERVSSRPDFGVLCYPVISMGSLAHRGSKNYLLGENPSNENEEFLSSEKHVTRSTPPCFIWHTAKDSSVSVEHSLEFARALAENAVPFDLHIYQEGRHGLGLADKYPFTKAHPWTSDLLVWLKVQGVVKE